MRRSNAKGLKALTNEINKTLKMYKHSCEEEIYETAKEVAKEAVEELKRTGDYEDKSGKYRKGFKVKPYRYYSYRGASVFNKEYRLTHLLEEGHMKANGKGRTKAFPHWKPVEEKAVKEFEERLAKRVGDIEI